MAPRVMWVDLEFEVGAFADGAPVAIEAKWLRQRVTRTGGIRSVGADPVPKTQLQLRGLELLWPSAPNG